MKIPLNIRSLNGHILSKSGLIRMSGLSAESYGVANAIVKNFFKALSEDPDSASLFYGENGVLKYKGRIYQGREAIRDFLQTQRNFTYEIHAWDFQSIANSDSWTLVVAMGSMISPERRSPFHCAFYIESRTEDHTGFIRYHMFN